jgi:hypothetical protein
MSSTLRSYAQTAPRASFLLTTVSGAKLYKTTLTESVVNLSLTTVEESVADLSSTFTVFANTLLRDMGRSLTLYVNNAAGIAMKVAVLREVQVVNGTATEGVSNNTAYLVPVWVETTPESDTFGTSSPSLAVEVVRCG